MCFEFNEFLLGYYLFVCLFTFRRISKKKKLLQNQLDSVPYSQHGSNISPIRVSCIRCGKIKQSGMDKFLSAFGREKNEKRVTEVIKCEEGD